MVCGPPKDEIPLYNSRIIKVFLQYLSTYHPDVDVYSLLEYSRIAKHEVEDQAHWFNQRQVDLFNEFLVKTTGKANIAREAGRYAASSEAFGTFKQYLLGFINLSAMYLFMERLYPIMSRAATVKARKLGSQKIEIISKPKSGVEEKPYQCENRVGMFESVATLFTSDFAKIEHPSCYHRGDEFCRYIISWVNPPSLIWKMLRNYALAIGVLASPALLYFLPIDLWLAIPFAFGFLTIAFSFQAQRVENKQLAKTLERQGNAGKNLLDEMNMRYNNALLVQEIGQAASTILDIDRLIKTVGSVMQKRLDFDRGMIMLANKDKSRLVYAAGYGYTEDQEELLRQTEFHLDKPDSKGVLVLCHKQQRPYLLNDIGEIEKTLSKRSQRFIKKMGVHSLICVPIVYEKESLGVLAVDNIKSKRSLTQSDMNLLLGVASQTAVNIIRAISFQKLQESEKKYRDLVENANSIILRMETNGRITFFNEFAQRFFGYAEDEIVGENIAGTLLPASKETKYDLEELVNTLEKEPEKPVVSEKQYALRNGELAWIAWTNKAIFNSEGQLIEILSIGNDITELKQAAEEKKTLAEQLQGAQKMEAVGTLAGGIAHDFNNILQAIIGYTQILLMGKNTSDPDYEKLEAIESSAQRASELTQRLLIFSRKVESQLKPVELNQEVVQVSKMLERTIPKMIEIELNLAENIKIINADPVQIEQVMMNLAVNARDAMPEGGKLIFETRNVTLDRTFCKSNLGSKPGQYVLLSVSDSGQGMSKDLQEHIFEPFFTTKETGKGTGLGLAMVYGIVKSHGGYIKCESEADHGASFSIYFPVLENGKEIRRFEEAKAPVKGGTERILLVDDEENILELGIELLTSSGYTVLTAPDGETALEVYRKENSQIDLIILDLNMPGMGGKRCLEQLIKTNPSIKVVVASGYSMDAATKDLVQAGAKGFVGKPYQINEMLRMIREILDM